MAYAWASWTLPVTTIITIINFNIHRVSLVLALSSYRAVHVV